MGDDSLRGGPQLKNFTDFKTALQTPKLANLLESIKDVTLVNMPMKSSFIGDFKQKVKEIYSLFSNEAKVMLTGRILIGTSKTLHHLHPDLFMPIDERHTIKFVKKIIHIPYNFDDFSTWWNVFICFCYIAKKIMDFSLYRREMDSSISKIIDNALIGYSALSGY